MKGLAKYPTGYKPLFNDTHDTNIIEDEPNGSTDNSRKENKDSVNKPKVNNNEYNYGEYKDEISAALINDERVI